MRRHFLTLLVAMIATTMSLNAQVILIDEGFENGIQDSVWTQEFVVGHQEWKVESLEDGLNYPANVWQGSKRAYLRNNTGETQGYVTRLISKTMDLRPDKVYQPELTFWYANPKWTADRDTLRVLYRTGPKAKWQQLAEFGTASANWQKVYLELPEVNETYQIAFEGTDNLGHGIVLDSIKLRSAPQCVIPHDISITHQGNGKVFIGWNASWDASSYDLIITKDVKINPDTINNVADTVIAVRESIEGIFQNYTAQLESGAYYYVYLRSVCDAEKSMWNSEDPAQSGDFRFRVKATKNIPYSYGFDMPYEPGILRRDLEWTWGNNMGNFNPFVNVGVPVENRTKYSKDGTTCVAFTNTNEPAATNATPAGKYAYVASPALADKNNPNFALNQCQVRFLTTVYQFTHRDFARSIIVGVMTDPEDITTFVAIDTVSVWGTSTFVENIVDLSSYTGDGMYVAFMSNFDKKNLIFIDDITIEYKTNATKATNIRVNPRDTWADITWESNAPTYNLMITNADVDPTKATAEQIVEQTTVTGNSYKTEALEADHSWNRPYYVHVQAVNGENKSEWSYRYPFVTIAAQKSVPYTFDFEQASGIYNIGDDPKMYPTNIGIFSNDPEYPYTTVSNAHEGSNCLFLTKDWGNDSWITLPPVDSLSDKEVQFYLSGSSTPTQAYATVGVMTNPMDFSTFVPVSECKLASTGYTRCYANFLNYKGPDGVIAIAWSDVDGGKQTINYIDDVVVQEMSKCIPPVNIVTDATSDSVTISWDASDASTWEFIFATKALTANQLKDTLKYIRDLDGVLYADTLMWDQPGNPTFGFDSLDYNTPYYIYVRTLCGEETAWWVSNSFKTPCPDNFPIPFFEDFEGVATGDYSGGFKCWQFAQYGTGTGYPKILNLTTGEPNGNMLELWSTSTTQRNLAMLPGLDADMKKVVLSFKTRSWSASAKSVIYVGSMSDITDWTTFVPVDTFYNENGNLTQVRMNLEDYNFAYNNIVFTSGLGDNLEMASDVMIDDISIKPNTCIEAWNFEATDIQTNSIDIKWQGKADNDEWVVKVMSDTVVLVADSTITGKAFHIGNLTAMTAYTFFVKPSCDTIWASATYRTSCVKLDPTKPNKEDFESITDATTSYKATSQIQCWTASNGNPGTGTSYLPYVYKSTTYSSSGNNTYRMYGTTTYYPAYVVTPEIDIENMKDLAVTFNMYATTSYWWICGVMSDPEDLSTFVVLDSVKGTGKSVQYTYNLSEYADSIPATAKYFAWRGRYGATDYSYLDDVSIIKMNCPLPKPSYSGLTAEQVRISAGLRTDNDWILLAVDTAAFTADQLALLNVDSLVNNDSLWQAHVVFYDTIDVKNKVVTGLTEQTDYYVAVAASCEDGLSQWQVISFRTPCKAVTPEAMGTITFSKDEGYVTGSGKVLPCWTTSNKTTTTSTSYIPYIGTTTSYMHNGNNYLYIYSYVPSSTTGTSYDGAYAIMPELNVADISKYQVNFWARTTSSTTAAYRDELIIGVVTDPSDLNTFTVIDTLHLSHSTYEPFSVSLEDYKGDYQGNKGRYIMFLTETGSTPGTLAYGYAYISEISVEAIPTCRPVTEFTVDSIAEDAAKISWKQYSDSYRMLVADKEVAEKDKATYEWLIDSTVTNTTGILLEGLKPATNYYVYAQALCDGGDSSSISMAYANVLTDCPNVNGYPVPYYNDFENGPSGSGKKPLCWEGVYLNYHDIYSSQTYPYVYTTASYSASTPNSVYMYSYFSSTTSYNCYAVAPKIAGNLNDYMISFYARTGGTTTSYGHNLLVGYVTDATQAGIDSTFVLLQTVYVDDNVQRPYSVDLTTLPAIPAGARIALHADASQQGLTGTTGYGTMYIDNFKIGLPPSCYAPKLTPGNTSLSTAEITITPAKDWNDQWQIAVVPDSIYSKADYDAASYLACDTVRIINADSTNFVVSGLDHSTLYWFYARTICGGDDGNSSWNDIPVSARTKYYYADSYFFGFEQEEGWERSPLSTSDSYIMHPAVEAGCVPLGTMPTSYSYMPHALITTSSGYNYGYGPSDWSMGKTGIRWNATSSYYGQYVIMPAVEEAHDRSFEFKFRNGYSYISSNKYIITSSNNVSIEVGTIDKFKGMETYQKLATISMDAYASSTECTEANDWLWRSYTFDIDSATIADKQIVFFQAQKPSASNYPYIDNVKMSETKGFGLVSIGKIQAEARHATVTWDSIGGPWSLYILKENGDTLKRYENISGTTSQVADGLSPQSKYTAVLVAANAPKDTKYYVKDSREFRTPCIPIEADSKGEFFWNFDDPNDTEPNDILAGAATDTAYLKPSCFTTATNYTGSYSNGYQWLWQSKGHDYYSTLGNPSDTYNHREIGYGDSYGSLRVYTTSTYVSETVKTWIVLPKLNCDLDTMMIEFWGRCFANQDETASSNAGKVISTTYLGASYSKSLVVGTLKDPHDFSTLEVIDTVTYVAPPGISTSTLVNTDANRYWQKFQLPMAGTSGDYIVLFQPAYGLFFVDNLKIKAVGDNLFAPSGAHTTNITENSAVLNWTVKHPAIQSVVVLLDANGTKELKRDTVPGTITSYTADGLNPATGYQWYMYQTNGTVNTTSTPNTAFYTECVAVGPDYKTGFELMDGWKLVPGATSDTYKQTLCWTYGNAGTTTAWSSSFPYNYVDGTSLYAHSGAYAPRLYATGTTFQTYIAMPAIEDVAAYDTLQINFWMRPTYVTKSTGKVYTTYLGTSYSKAVIVGTMSDPNDASTFVPIDTLNYDLNPSSTDIASELNESFFQKKKVALAGATGKYVAFMATLYAKGDEKKYSTNYMYIDDVWFSPIQHCEAPVEMTSSDINSTSAKLSWDAPTGAEKYVLQVSTDFTYSDENAFAFNDTVVGNSYVVTGLKAFTEYTWHVSTICEGDLGGSDFSQNAAFLTAREPFFVETFGAADLDADWTFATNPAVTVIDSTDVELTGSNSTTYGWRRTNLLTSDYHYAVIFYSSSTASSTDYDYYWMISPTISLDANKPAHLTLDMALTGCSGTSTIAATRVKEAQMADDYTFAIAVSEDGGKTWKKENILAIWNNKLPAGNQLRDIPFEPSNIRFDLAKYAGKNIRIAFYREADTYKSASPYTCALHMDNIRINYYDEISGIAEACQYNDIDELGFYIDGDKAAAGARRYERFDYAYNFDANTKGYRDSIYRLDVTYLEVPERVIEETICEGESYIDENFTGKNRTGVYRRKLESVEHCDSIVTLHLFVAPKESSSEFDTICYGDTYKWHGKEFNRSGLYTDTLVSQYGCDSVLYLNLFVRDQITGEEKKEICYGSSYTWPANGETYTESGTHKATLKSVLGCDSIVTLTVEVSDILHGEPQKEVICHGGKFNWNGKVYDKAGIYTDTVKSAYGCDSVNTLELTVAPMIEGIPTQLTICSGTTYTWGGKILSQAGTYKDTLVAEGGCDSVAILVLKIADIIIGEPVKQAICEGATYTWNGKVYDTAGTYKDTLQSAGGCDSVATLVLSVSSILYGEPENVSICEGDSYQWNGNNYTLPGTFKDTVPSSFGCDSIITLVLTYYGEEDTIRIDSTITLAQLPFTYENAAYPYAAGQTPISYAEGTELGTYSDTVFVEGKHCTAVMILNLTIDEEHSIGNVGDNNVVLRPNVIRAGESVTAYGNFNGTVHIQVYDVIGRLVAEERNDAKSSISINAFPQSGIYTVRISDSDATQYVGRVLVK